MKNIKFPLETKNIRCIEKILSVCNNRQCPEIGSAILKNIAPIFLNPGELEAVKSNTAKNIIFAQTVSFLKGFNFPKECAYCSKEISKQEPGFINGKLGYHVLCGLDSLGEQAATNLYYQKWLKGKKTLDIS